MWRIKTLFMFSPNWEDNATDIKDYLNDSNFFKCRKTEELCSFLDTKSLKPEDFDLFFSNISTYHDKHTILDILSHTNVEYGNSISEILLNISTLFHVLKIPLLLKMTKSIDSIFHNIMTSSIISEIKSIQNTQNQQHDKMIKKVDETKQSQIQNIVEVKNKLDEIKKTHDTKIVDVKWKIDDVLKTVKLMIRTEKFNKMKMIQKTSNNFDQIYSIFEKIANDDDYISMKLVVESGYHEVTAEKDSHTRNISTHGAVNNNFKLVKMLVECGVNPSKNDPSGSNPVWLFCRKNNLEAVKYFCELPGADVNSPSNHKDSLLLIASFNDYYDICCYLLTLKGSDVNMKSTSDGSTALSVAKSDRVRDLLKSHGAN